MDDRIIDAINRKTEEIEGYLIGLRRNFHRYPELGFEEKRTGAIIAEKLCAIGAEVKSGLAETGLIALIRGRGKGRCVALRADMDGIAIQDMKKVEYASCVKNVMHACGHDAHMAIAVGVGIVLNDLRDEFDGVVKLIFQPSEEIGLHGVSGAAEMIKDGALKKPDVDAIFGMHCWPELRAGTVGINYGAAMAAADSLTLEVYGETAHAGAHHLGRDGILAVSEMIVALHHVVSRNTDPAEPVVIHIGQIEGGRSRAILADHVHAYGTLRTVNEATRRRIRKRINEVVSGIARAYGVKAEAVWTGSCPPVINDERLTKLAEEVARKVIGARRVVRLDSCPMTSEDFALFAQEVPGCYLKIGIADSRTGKSLPLHHNRFDIDEKAISTGVRVLSAALYEYLAHE